jgi:hypothetical protein
MDFCSQGEAIPKACGFEAATQRHKRPKPAVPENRRNAGADTNRKGVVTGPTTAIMGNGSSHGEPAGAFVDHSKER